MNDKVTVFSPGRPARRHPLTNDDPPETCHVVRTLFELAIVATCVISGVLVGTIAFFATMWIDQ